MSILEVAFDSYHVETMWQWPSSCSTPAPHYTARVIKTSINRKGNVSTACLTPKDSNVSVDPDLVVLKTARGAENIALLEREAQIYENELRRLQGNVIPVCYGLYRGQSESRCYVGLRERVACMVLEYCSPQRDMHPVDLGQSVIAAALTIHQAGIVHNGLLNKQNIIPYGHDGVRILDFAAASRRHLCPTSVYRHGEGCEEIVLVERKYGGSMPQIPGYHGRW
ncbi:hypothetical protein Moror_16366 [Moniliophthora roreri MCA 2997]|uniref:Protein kinase domain-containing protein n=2 Tax=Moniliophthora roreri TaxID=221103 RepID=V2WVS3_MONRO|nr:hypothetical protein Moror_16366 [Moniliophthora roreri MCA 2997]